MLKLAISAFLFSREGSLLLEWAGRRRRQEHTTRSEKIFIA
jgi:hypothetical protein